VTSRVGRIELDEPAYRPPIYTHSEWCKWLFIRGQLAIPHRRCMSAERCMAKAHRKADETWRYQKHEPDVSR
jgi:hypothetical protein